MMAGKATGKKSADQNTAENRGERNYTNKEMAHLTTGELLDDVCNSDGDNIESESASAIGLLAEMSYAIYAAVTRYPASSFTLYLLFSSAPFASWSCGLPFLSIPVKGSQRAGA